MRMETGENANQHPKLQTLTASIDEFEILLMEDCRDSKLCRHRRTTSSFYVDEESKDLVKTSLEAQEHQRLTN